MNVPKYGYGPLFWLRPVFLEQYHIHPHIHPTLYLMGIPHVVGKVVDGEMHEPVCCRAIPEVVGDGLD